MARKLKILIIDESPTVQKQLAGIINGDQNMVVVGVACDPYIAREKIKQFDPDVLTLDVNLPKMDGITFLRNLMRLRPMPVLMVVDDDAESLAMVDSARKIGAKGVFVKKSLVVDSPGEKDISSFLSEIRSTASEKVEIQLSANVTEENHSAGVSLQYSEPALVGLSETLIAIGASTGGTEAIQKVLVELPADSPAIVITQHIPISFSGAFADRINKLSKLNVTQATDGERIIPGHVYIAPGDQHLMVVCKNSKYFCALSDGPAVNRHRPSVDVLFRSIAQTARQNGIGVLLTGMGSDGAEGLLEMKKAKAQTFAQDEATSIVWGMPGSAVKRGAVDEVVPLDQMAGKILEQLKTRKMSNKVKDFTRLRRCKR